MDLETIIYAMAAVIIFMKLWSVFGRRNEDDRQQPNPFGSPSSSLQSTDDEESLVNGLITDHPPILRPSRAAPESLAGGLEQIKTLDPAFDEKPFLQGARSAFTMIIENFAKGDLAPVARFLSPQVRQRFQDAISQRSQAGHSLEHTLEHLKEVETVSARAEGSKAFVTVRFISAQKNILHDSTGSAANVADSKTQEITDIWTFSRDTTSPDPNWILIETRS